MRLFMGVVLAGLVLALAGCGSGSCSLGAGCSSTESGSFQCTYTSSSTCDSSQTPGHCASVSLIGCCVSKQTVEGCVSTAAACYYEGFANTANLQSSCTPSAFGNVPGVTVSWEATPP